MLSTEPSPEAMARADVEKAIDEWWGRCDEYNEDCPTCIVWDYFKGLLQDRKRLEWMAHNLLPTVSNEPLRDLIDAAMEQSDGE